MSGGHPRAETTPRLSAWLRRFADATGGGIALWAAVALPPLAVCGVAAVELASIHSDKSALQDAADAAALAGARELGFAGPGGVIERTQANALEQVAAVRTRQTVTAAVTLPDDAVVRVELRAHRGSFFGDLLPPGGFNTVVESTASALGSTPLCVVGMKAGSNNIHMHNTSRIQSPACLVQSNGNVQVDGGAGITAAEVQATGSASGSISPAALTGAPALPDPFAGRNRNFPATCNPLDVLTKVLSGQTRRLYPGKHCGGGDITVESGGTLILEPGVHHFQDLDIKLSGNARLEGNGVVLIFDNKSSIEAKDNSIVNLQGLRQQNPWTGFVIVGPAAGGEEFKFESGRIDRLEGVIYLPSSKLTVDSALTSPATGSTQVGEQSNWTVTLANELDVKGPTRLVINANYSASTVPVPTGVGPRTTGTRLSR